MSAKATQLTEFYTASHLQYKKIEDWNMNINTYDYSHVDIFEIFIMKNCCSEKLERWISVRLYHKLY